jgi:hypothetical protein
MKGISELPVVVKSTRSILPVLSKAAMALDLDDDDFDLPFELRRDKSLELLADSNDIQVHPGYVVSVHSVTRDAVSRPSGGPLP